MKVQLIVHMALSVRFLWSKCTCKALMKHAREQNFFQCPQPLMRNIVALTLSHSLSSGPNKSLIKNQTLSEIRLLDKLVQIHCVFNNL